MTYSGSRVFANLERFSKYNACPIYDEAGIFFWILVYRSRSSNSLLSIAGFKPSVSEAIEIMERLFEKLKAASDGQTLALKEETAFDIYFKDGFVLQRDFKFLTDGSVQPDTQSMAIYEQFLPFNSQLHTDEGCVPVKELPLFYKNKGVDKYKD